MARIAFIGAGSVIFTRTLVNDLLAFPELRDELELVLHDIDPRRLEVAGAVARHVCKARAAPAEVRETLDRREALDGVDYVIFTVQVGGHDATLRDFEIPRRHGIRATIGDTLGVGGVFRALRTFPVICETARELAELSPHAWLLNYTNPMAMLCWAVYAGTPLTRVVGLCHSVQGTAGKLAALLGLGPVELEYDVAGVNHLAFFLRLSTTDGEDLYPRLEAAIAADPEGRGRTVRAELHRRLGYFVTESSEHAAEYVPWFLGDPEQRERFRISLDEYARRSEANLAEFERVAEAVGNGDGLPLGTGHEYAPRIIHALETGEPFRFNGNVRNAGLIENLPSGACVEVRCTADGEGIRPHPVGALPPQLAALGRAYLNVCELAVQAYLEGRRDFVYHACALDPGVAGQNVSLDRVWAACDDLFEAHGDLIPAELRRPSRSASPRSH